MIAKELIDRLDQDIKNNLWDIIIDGKEYNDVFKEDTPTLDSEVKTWSLDYGIVDHFFQLSLRIYTVDYEPYFFEDTK